VGELIRESGWRPPASFNMPPATRDASRAGA
jgi:hypothetical protein